MAKTRPAALWPRKHVTVKPAGASPLLNFETLKLPDTLVLGLLLFPGLLSERVAAYFVDAPSQSALQAVTSGLAATLLNLAATLLFAMALRRWFAVLDFRNQRLQEIVVRPSFIIVVTAVSVFTGLIWAYADSHDALFKLIGVSDRVSRRDVWVKAVKRATEQGHLARVMTSDNAAFHGHIQYVAPGANGGIYIERAQIELSEERTAARLRNELKRCDEVECRVPVGCIHVGRGYSGAVFLPLSKVKVIEFRPPLDKEQRVIGGVTHELSVYSCDVIATRPLATSVTLPVRKTP